jgi:hypothetical protein
MTAERHHAIGQSLGDGELPGDPEERLRTEPDDEEMDYRFLSSVAERRGVVETSPSDKGGQTFFDFASDMVEEPEEVVQPIATGEGSEVTRLLAEQKKRQRRRGGALSSLVNELYRSHKVPYAKIHAHLNSLQKVNGQSQCTLEQLEEREELLRSWLREGSPPQKVAK